MTTHSPTSVEAKLNILLGGVNNKPIEAKEVEGRRFVLVLEASRDAGDPQGYLRLRSALKVLLRRFGLRCIEVTNHVTIKQKRSTDNVE